MFVVIGVAGCEKKSGEGVVIGKDYVAAVKEGEKTKDERATNHEQWIVKVRMLDNGRRIDVRAEVAGKRSSQGQLPCREIYRNRLGF